METIHERIVDWAEKYVPIFNELSDKYNTYFYTQSPLNEINAPVDTMIIGINPKGNLNGGGCSLSAEEYISGNSSWYSRFDQNGKNQWNFNHGVRFFLGYDDYRHPESIDDDRKTVWTNLSPFESRNGSSDLRTKLMTEGVKSTLELIRILSPKRIILLGVNAFEQLKRCLGGVDQCIEFSPVFSNIKSKIGRIYGIPTVCVPHPSRQWEVSNAFIPVFIYLHHLAEMTNKKDEMRPLKEIVQYMRHEMELWQGRVEL